MRPQRRTIQPPLRRHRGRAAGSAGRTDDATELALARAHHRALEMIAAGLPLETILEHIVCTIEEHAPGMRGSVVLLPDGVHMRPSVAPNIPGEYMAAFDGFPIGPVAGSCGTAMWRDRRVVVSDITTDDLWAPYQEVIAAAREAGLRACWSTPLRASTGRVVGSFAMYYAEPRQPTSRDLAMADTASHLCALAVEHAFAYDQLERRGAQQAAVATLGEQALAAGEDERLMSELVVSVTVALEGSRAALFEHTGDGRRMRAAAGWPAGEAPEPGLAVRVDVPGVETIWGVLAVQPPAGASWGEEELAFLRSLANVLDRSSC